MTCQEIQHWLLLSKPAVPLPGAVRRHLDACPRCRLRCEQLRLLDDQINGLPPPPPDPSAKERLMARIARTPQQRSPAPAVRLHLRWVAAAAVAASLLIAVTWIVARRPAANRSGDDVALTEGTSPSPLRAGAGGIVLRVAKLDVQLANPAAVEEQLDLLTQLAGDLKDEAIRLAKQGPSEDVQLLGDLASSVLRQGVVGRAARLPVGKRPELVPPLVEQLRATETEIDGFCKDRLPAVANMLRPIGSAARESAELIEAGRSVAEGGNVASPDGPARPLIASLVVQGLKLADEGNPVRRADLAAELASLLTPAIVLLSAHGDADGAEALGDCLGDLLVEGVTNNLAQAEEAGMTEAQKAEAKTVRERSIAVISGLEDNLAHAPPDARAGLQQAIEASGGRDAAQAGNGKTDRPAPPARHKGKPKVPPSLQKKLPKGAG